jgi:3-dehydroquinate dehydratase type I
VSVRICVSILPKNNTEALKLVEKAEGEGADLIEVRLDLFEESRNLKNLVESTNLPLIATNKLQSEKGFFSGNETERQKTLINAAKNDFEYIDVDFQSPKRSETISMLQGLRAKTIISYHDYNGILTTPALKKILDEQIGMGASVCKIVLTAKHVEDNLPILSFISFASTAAQLVCFCMGEEGKTSRLLSTMFGAYFTFATLDTTSLTAPGQMTINEMRTAYKLLGIRQ